MGANFWEEEGEESECGQCLALEDSFSGLLALLIEDAVGIRAAARWQTVIQEFNNKAK